MAEVKPKSPFEDFDDLKAQIDAFSAHFDRFILEKKTSVHNSKQRHINRINELQRNIQKLRDDIATHRIQRDKMAETIAATLLDLQAKQVKVDGLSAQLESLQQTQRVLDREIADMRADVLKLQAALDYAKSDLNLQTERDNEELTKFEMYLGLRIVAVDVDLLKFKFMNVDANDIDREVSCELYVGDDEYKLGRTVPVLPAEQTASAIAELNRHGEILRFLKEMRKLLRDAPV